MKAFGYSILFLIFFLVSFAFSGEGTTVSPDSGLAMEKHRPVTTMSVKNRKLKGGGLLSGNGDENNNKAGKEGSGSGSGSVVNLEDYRPIDPVPSSKASIRPGPIQHGTPFLPYIPKPSPPPDTTSMDSFP